MSLSFSASAPLSLSQSATYLEFEDPDGAYIPVFFSQSEDGETCRQLRARKMRVDYAAMDPKIEKAMRK